MIALPCAKGEGEGRGALRRAALLLLLGSSLASAQPAMIDPSRMSGIPRPDGEVPPGTLTVRVLRGDFAHPLIGQEVQLRGPAGSAVEKVGENHRAVFKGLQAGMTYIARSTAFGVTLESQPIQMPPSPGVKLMLVFPRDEQALLGEPDGKARKDASLPGGTLVVKAVDGDGKALPDVAVLLAHAIKDDNAEGKAKIEETKSKTDESGAAKFPGLAAGGNAYIVKAIGNDTTAASEPFRLEGKEGLLLVLRLPRPSHEAASIVVSERSHFIADVQEEAVQVIENLVIDNQGTAAFDPGGNGLRLPLPEGVNPAQAQAKSGGEGGPMTAPQVKVAIEGNDCVIRGQLPPGPTSIQLGFLLPIQDNAVTLRQTTPIAFQQLVMVVDRFEGMDVIGNKIQKTEKTLPTGRLFWVLHGPGTPPGGTLQVTLTGLPHPSSFWRNAAAVVAGLLVLYGLAMAVRPPTTAAGGVTRAQVEQKRQQLLGELVALERQQSTRKTGGKAAETKYKKRREDLVSQLEQAYRELEEGEAGASDVRAD